MEKLKILPCYHFLLEPVHCSAYLWTGYTRQHPFCDFSALYNCASPLFWLSMDWLKNRLIPTPLNNEAQCNRLALGSCKTSCLVIIEIMIERIRDFVLQFQVHRHYRDGLIACLHNFLEG